MSAVKSSRNRKACGPDKIYNEHIKESRQDIGEEITTLFNNCLSQGKSPNIRRKATIKMHYKGKGDTVNPNSYRGIILECSLFKLLTSLLTTRLTELVDADLPEEQFGFRRGRNTTQAVNCLQNDIEDALSKPKGKLHAIFVDFTKAFDTIRRDIVITKLQNFIGHDNYLCNIITSILSENYIEIDDGISRSRPIRQTVGVLQGDPLSPLLYI